jgi:hypothetical protein
VLSLLDAKIHIDRVSELSGISRKQIYYLRKQAKKQDYNPIISSVICKEYVTDKPHSGRPKKITKELKQEILEDVGKNHKGREKTS